MKFDDLIETIDMLDATQADEIIDWQMTDSPAAQVQRTGCGWFPDHDELEVVRRDMQQAIAMDTQALYRWDIDASRWAFRDSVVAETQASLRVPPRPPRMTEHHELALGIQVHLLLPVTTLADWWHDQDITRVTSVPVTTVCYNVEADTWVNATAHRISWYYPDHHYDALERMVTDEMAQRQVSGPLGRKSIGDGWEAQLGVNNGVVKAALVRYE